MDHKEKKRRAIECARSRRSCPGCDLQFLCQGERIMLSRARETEYIAALPEWKRKYYGMGG